MASERTRVAAEAYAISCARLRAAEDAAIAAYDRYDTDPDNIEYVIEWHAARLREAAFASRMRRAEAALRAAGGSTVEHARHCE
jgi:hypothetical protein